MNWLFGGGVKGGTVNSFDQPLLADIIDALWQVLMAFLSHLHCYVISHDQKLFVQFFSFLALLSWFLVSASVNDHHRVGRGYSHTRLIAKLTDINHFYPVGFLGFFSATRRIRFRRRKRNIWWQPYEVTKYRVIDSYQLIVELQGIRQLGQLRIIDT